MRPESNWDKLRRGYRLTTSAATINNDAAAAVQLIPVSQVYQSNVARLAGGGGDGSAGWFDGFVPRPALIDDSPSVGAASEKHADAVPEKALTLFALRLAVMEKLATALGQMAFVWATVVILGGLFGQIRRIDFYMVTVILVGEGARVFSRSHELEWQHNSTGTLVGLGRRSLRRLRSSSRYLVRIIRGDRAAMPEGDRDVAVEEEAAKARKWLEKLTRSRKQWSWHPAEVSLLPIDAIGWLFTTTNVSLALSALQIAFALGTVVLSIYRLITNRFSLDGDDDAAGNQKPAMILFYCLALLEAATLLMQKVFWWWEMRVRKVLNKVNRESGLGEYGHVALRRFFYDSYSECVSGSIFDGIKMNLVTFSLELLHSEFHDEQLIAARVLLQLVRGDRSAPGTLRKLGTSSDATERLIEMLEWKSAEEEEIRKCAAEILSRLAAKRTNALRVAGIPGSIESISSLLHTAKKKKKGSTAAPDHQSDAEREEWPGAAAAMINIGEKEEDGVPSNYDYSGFNLHGLVILENLARDPNNSWKIGSARGLLPMIIDHTAASEHLLRDELAAPSQILTVKSALQVVKRLVTTPGNTGKTLRREVADIVFTMSNLRDILCYGERHIDLQLLAIDVLNGIAMDEVAKERIATTGGMVKLLLTIFCRTGYLEANKLSADAGETLALLALEDPANCDLILKRKDVLPRLIPALSDDALRLNASRILRNLCAYSSPESSPRLTGVTAALPAVVKATMSEQDKLLEVSVGLTMQICKFMDGEQFSTVLQQQGVEGERYAARLAGILRQYKFRPEMRVPRMRRFIIQQANWMMKAEHRWVQLFREAGMEELLEWVADTTSDMECYHVFSGSAGISKHRKSVSSIVEAAQELLQGRQLHTDHLQL